MIIGLVGLPSSGKSTFFKAATLADVAIANYPFTTIEKNEGIAFVRVECAEKFFNVKCNPRFGYCIEGTRFVPVQLIDVAGLVPGAYMGRGRGNQFLNDLAQADVLIHIVDISGSINENGEQVQMNSIYPARYIEILEIELDMWYFGILRKGWEKFARQVQQEKQEISKALFKQLSGLKVTEQMVETVIKKLNLHANPETWNEEQLKQLSRELRILSKPMIIAANKIDIKGAFENYERVKKQFSHLIIIPCSGDSELALREAAKNNLISYVPGSDNLEIKGSLNDKQLNALNFIKENVLDRYKSTGVQDVLDISVFRLGKQIAIFPGGMNKLTDQYGNILPDCFLISENSTALDFAYKIHTDLGKKFIKAVDVKNKKIIGKEHVLKNLDVIEIVTSK
ncbi:MAG: redox-regulated ATPase YchF [Nanoarchaeota archaeon]